MCACFVACVYMCIRVHSARVNVRMPMCVYVCAYNTSLYLVYFFCLCSIYEAKGNPLL